ncbi:maleylpyruvate isomerase family mycothiol-dependent enzyme [Streptomyces sp. 7R007]
MTSLPFERHCDEIVRQTGLLAAHVSGADPTAPVPSCPAWNLGQLLRHVGGDHRWAEEVVRTRATGPVPDAQVNDLSAYTHEDVTTLVPWLAEGAAALAATLRHAGPDTKVWSPAEEQFQSTAFWARRMAHETAVHRADAALVTGARFALADDLAVDAVEEWLEFGTVPEAYEPGPDTPGLLGPGRTLRFHAPGAGEWGVDLTGERPRWSSGPVAKAAVTVRGPVTDLLLFLYRRPAPAVEAHGDAELLQLWLTRTGFWLEL